MKRLITDEDLDQLKEGDIVMYGAFGEYTWIAEIEKSAQWGLTYNTEIDSPLSILIDTWDFAYLVD